MNTQIDNESDEQQAMKALCEYHGFKHQAQLILHLQEQLEEKVEKIITRMRQAGLLTNYGWDIEGMQCDSFHLHVNLEKWYQGDRDTEYVIIDMEVFQSDEKLDEWLNTAKAAHEAKEAQKAADIKRRQEASDRAAYEKLKAKFGDK